MAMRRRWARRLLGWAVRLAPAGSREWAAAMLHELEFVEGEWQALWWSVGGVSVIARRLVWEKAILGAGALQRWRERAMEQMGKKTGWLVIGAVGTVALMLAAFGLLYWTAASFPQLGIERSESTHLLVVVAMPAAICIGIAVWLWKRRRPLAIGILLSLLAMGTHVSLHFAHQFAGH